VSSCKERSFPVEKLPYDLHLPSVLTDHRVIDRSCANHQDIKTTVGGGKESTVRRESDFVPKEAAGFGGDKKIIIFKDTRPGRR
jgi:hypothetical protein